MTSMRQVQDLMSRILTIGSLLSAFLVLAGGVMHLVIHGEDIVRSELLTTNEALTSLTAIWNAAISFSSFGLIELGLVFLVGTQALRVLFLVIYYLSIHDYIFFIISSFVLTIMLYSFFYAP